MTGNFQGAFTDGSEALQKIKQMSAAADFMGNGSLEVNRYESEIYDCVVRSGPALQRFKAKPATGHPHRYFEQTAIGTAVWSDPRVITTTASGPTRIEQACFIKCLTNQTNLSLFDIDVTRQQGQYTGLESKDIQDAVNAILKLEAAAVWNGNDTALNAPTTTQYMGILNQILATSTIANGASIVDGLKAAVAGMVARTDFEVSPTAIYLNPILGDYIDREAKAQRIDLSEMEVTAGVKVKAINTQAGILPLIPDKFIPSSTASAYGFSAPAAGLKNYFAVIVTEDAVEMPFIDGGTGNPKPRIFQLGLLAGLQGQYVAVHFNAVLVKGASYSHQVVCVVRP